MSPIYTTPYLPIAFPVWFSPLGIIFFLLEQWTIEVDFLFYQSSNILYFYCILCKSSQHRFPNIPYFLIQRAIHCLKESTLSLKDKIFHEGKNICRTFHHLWTEVVGWQGSCMRGRTVKVLNNEWLRFSLLSLSFSLSTFSFWFISLSLALEISSAGHDSSYYAWWQTQLRIYDCFKLSGHEAEDFWRIVFRELPTFGGQISFVVVRNHCLLSFLNNSCPSEWQ